MPLYRITPLIPDGEWEIRATSKATALATLANEASYRGYVNQAGIPWVLEVEEIDDECEWCGEPGELIPVPAGDGTHYACLDCNRRYDLGGEA